VLPAHVETHTALFGQRHNTEMDGG
jgi:hypothetical protein